MSALQSKIGRFFSFPALETEVRKCVDFCTKPVTIIIKYSSNVFIKCYKAIENVPLILTIRKTETGLRNVVYQPCLYRNSNDDGYHADTVISDALYSFEWPVLLFALKFLALSFLCTHCELK